MHKSCKDVYTSIFGQVQNINGKIIKRRKSKSDNDVTKKKKQKYEKKRSNASLTPILLEKNKIKKKLVIKQIFTKKMVKSTV